MSDVADRLRALADAATGPWEKGYPSAADFEAAALLGDKSAELARGYADALDALAASVADCCPSPDDACTLCSREHALLAEAGRLLGDNTA